MKRENTVFISSAPCIAGIEDKSRGLYYRLGSRTNELRAEWLMLVSRDVVFCWE